MADVVDGQASGGGGNCGDTIPMSAPRTTYSSTNQSLNIDRRRLAEWRGAARRLPRRRWRRPSRPHWLRGALRPRRMSSHRTRFTGDNEWYTPVKYIKPARQVLGEIDLDPASCSFAQAREVLGGCASTWTSRMTWPGVAGRVFMIRCLPVGEIEHFCSKKVVASVQSGADLLSDQRRTNRPPCTVFTTPRPPAPRFVSHADESLLNDSVIAAPVNWVGHPLLGGGRFRKLWRDPVYPTSRCRAETIISRRGQGRSMIKIRSAM